VANLILERTFADAMSVDDVLGMVEDGADCMGLYRVEWQESLLARDGHRMICHFEAPDTESLRMVMRTFGQEYESVWSGTLHPVPELPEPLTTVVVERRFAQPTDFKEVADQEEASSWCLDARNVKFGFSYFSADQKRMICAYQAPDAESVRQAQQQAKMPFDAIWPGTTVSRSMR